MVSTAVTVSVAGVDVEPSQPHSAHAHPDVVVTGTETGVSVGAWAGGVVSGTGIIIVSV
jgi:hypothetical protein